MLPDGTINPGEMTSFNHYALGAVVDFLQRVVAGLAPAEPGYRTGPGRGRRPGAGVASAARYWRALARRRFRHAPRRPERRSG
jgi:alpha-L-rhamnosidase